MKRLNIYQITDLLNYLADNSYEDEADIKAVNMTLKVLGYNGMFRYNEERSSIVWSGSGSFEKEEG